MIMFSNIDSYNEWQWQLSLRLLTIILKYVHKEIGNIYSLSLHRRSFIVQNNNYEAGTIVEKTFVECSISVGWWFAFLIINFRMEQAINYFFLRIRADYCSIVEKYFLLVLNEKQTKWFVSHILSVLTHVFFLNSIFSFRRILFMVTKCHLINWTYWRQWTITAILQQIKKKSFVFLPPYVQERRNSFIK